MKKNMMHLAGLTLAATLFALPSLAQNNPNALDRPGKPGVSKRVAQEISEDGENAMSIARAAVADSNRNGHNVFALAGGGDRPLIVSSSSVDEKALNNFDEDLNIMSRILEKAITRSGVDESERKAMGINLWAVGEGGRGARNLYLDGYGAVFVLNVNMPLIAPTTKPEPEEKKEATNSAWEDAKGEIYGRSENRRIFKRAGGDKKAARPYDAARVDALKKDLAEALKNGTHIRGLKDNENVTVVVQGSGSDSGQQFKTISDEGSPEAEVFAFSYSGPGSGARSVMTLRAKKSDIDAFAKGKTDIDDFRKKITTTIYQAPAGSGGGGSRGQMRIW